MKRIMLLILSLLLAVVLAACNDKTETSKEDNNTEQEAITSVEITEEEKVDNDSVVLSINGSEVKGDKYNNIYKQYKTMLHMYGQDTSDSEKIKAETIAILTEQELIRQAAVNSGLEVTDEEAQVEVDNILEANGEDAMTTMLEEYELTEDEFLDQLKVDLLTIKYIESEFEVEVTDEEIEEQYNLLKEENEELGELEEYEEVIRQNLMQQKQGEMLEARISELKEEAKIETFI